MFSNNEIGTIGSIAELAKIAHSHGAVFHTDVVQSSVHPPIEVKLLCDNGVMDAIIDQFGPSIQTHAGDLQKFRVVEKVTVGKLLDNIKEVKTVRMEGLCEDIERCRI